MNLLSPFMLTSCMLLVGCADRSAPVPAHQEEHSVITEERATIIRHIGPALASQVPEEYVVTTSKALSLLYSEEAEKYTDWKGFLTKDPLRPLSKIEVGRLDFIHRHEVVHIFLEESKWLNQRYISILWNEGSDRCEEISIAMP